MTNFEYIISNLTERDLAAYEFPYSMKPEDMSNLFQDKIYGAWRKWAESASTNHGNMVKGVHGRTIINEDPSIWAWEIWHYPLGETRKVGRSLTISFLVWLSKQYDPADWADDDS